MARVLVLGLASVDFVLAVDDLPREALKYRAKDAAVVGGGQAANAAVAIARLGGEPVLASRLGDDAFGELVLDGLVREGVSTDFIDRAPGGRSSFSSVLIDHSGERQIVNFRGDGLTDETGWIENLPRADAVLADTRWPEGARTALELASGWGVPGVIDGEAPVPPGLLRAASHVALSRQGLASLSDEEDLSESLATAAAQTRGWLCVTDGENGVLVAGPGGGTRVPPFPVEVVDTLGAGDVWHGAFTLALAEGQAELAAVRFANAAAALKCTRFGGRAGCPNRAEVDALLKEAPR